MKEFDILVSVNDSFLTLLKAMLHSLFINNPNRKINIHLMYSDLSQVGIDEIGIVVSKYSGEFYCYKASEKHINAAPALGRFSVESFFKLIAFEYIPDSVQKLLWLDADIIVNGSIDELYDTPMYADCDDGTVKKYLFAAVSGEITDSDKQAGAIYKEQLGMPASAQYAYSGLLLINLALLRTVITADEIFDLCIPLEPILTFPDQDMLNMLFHKYIIYLDAKRYCCMPLITDKTNIELGDPTIIHYNGIKPSNPKYPQITPFLRESKILYELYASLG